jgi:hypothetical protein
MTRFVRMTLFSALVVGLAACGGGAKLGGGKEGAAQAAFQASQPTGRSGASNGQALLAQALASGATSLTVTASCTKGGNATLSLDADETTTDPNSGAVSFTYDVTYKDCNEDGKNALNGSMRTTLTANFASDGNLANFSMTYKLKGRLDISGEVSDFVNADVTMTMSATASSTHTGSVAITMDGTIATSTETHVYNNERINITAGELPKA